jgi:hypothetical protein
MLKTSRRMAAGLGGLAIGAAAPPPPDLAPLFAPPEEFAQDSNG